MTEKELSAMTVMQLRKLAKENSITLGAGIDKAGIVRKILDVDGIVNSVIKSDLMPCLILLMMPCHFAGIGKSPGTEDQKKDHKRTGDDPINWILSRNLL